MDTQDTRPPLLSVAALAALLLLLIVTLRAHNWPTAIICGGTLMALLAKRLGLLTWYGRLPKAGKIGVNFLILVCLEIPIVVFSGEWRVYAVIICVLTALASLAWAIWRARAAEEERIRY
jgi:hypothetical protein